MRERKKRGEGMRKSFGLFCLPVLLLLSSCSRPASNPGVRVQEQEGEVFVAGVSIYDFQDDFMELYREELKKYLEESYGAKIHLMDGQESEDIQKQQIKEFLETAPDVMIINPVSAKIIGELADMCSEREIPAVFVNVEPYEEEIERWKKEKISACYVGTDIDQAGTYQGEIILSMPDKGDLNRDGRISCIMITGDENNPEAGYRREYAEKAVREGGLQVEVLFSRPGNWQEKEGEQLAAEALQQYGERAEVIFCGNDAMAIGAERAIKKAGRTVGKDIYLVGVDALREAVAMVRDGRMSGTVLNDYVSQAHMAGDAAMGMAEGERQEYVIRTEYVKIIMGE
ncbi:substrate-binding domain-containing protein [Lachnospiraceae bacterium 62-35]